MACMGLLLVKCTTENNMSVFMLQVKGKSVQYMEDAELNTVAAQPYDPFKLFGLMRAAGSRQSCHVHCTGRRAVSRQMKVLAMQGCSLTTPAERTPLQADMPSACGSWGQLQGVLYLHTSAPSAAQTACNLSWVPQLAAKPDA